MPAAAGAPGGVRPRWHDVALEQARPRTTEGTRSPGFSLARGTTLVVRSARWTEGPATRPRHRQRSGARIGQVSARRRSSSPPAPRGRRVRRGGAGGGDGGGLCPVHPLASARAASSEESTNTDRRAPFVPIVPIEPMTGAHPHAATARTGGTSAISAPLPGSPGTAVRMSGPGRRPPPIGEQGDRRQPAGGGRPCATRRPTRRRPARRQRQSPAPRGRPTPPRGVRGAGVVLLGATSWWSSSGRRTARSTPKARRWSARTACLMIPDRLPARERSGAPPLKGDVNGPVSATAASGPTDAHESSDVNGRCAALRPATGARVLAAGDDRQDHERGRVGIDVASGDEGEAAGGRLGTGEEVEGQDLRRAGERAARRAPGPPGRMSSCRALRRSWDRVRRRAPARSARYGCHPPAAAGVVRSHCWFASQAVAAPGIGPPAACRPISASDWRYAPSNDGSLLPCRGRARTGRGSPPGGSQVLPPEVGRVDAGGHGDQHALAQVPRAVVRRIRVDRRASDVGLQPGDDAVIGRLLDPGLLQGERRLDGGAHVRRVGAPGTKPSAFTFVAAHRAPYPRPWSGRVMAVPRQDAAGSDTNATAVSVATSGSAATARRVR